MKADLKRQLEISTNMSIKNEKKEKLQEILNKTFSKT